MICYVNVIFYLFRCYILILIGIGYRRETIFIKRIVKEINKRLELNKRSNIPHLIGMESSIRTITSFLTDESSHTTDILTIWGMPGIGKTYLANYIFKLHYLAFERSSFLEDIERRCKQTNALLDLQKQLLKDIHNSTWKDINDVKVATSKIEKLLLRNKTLLVLDGVDHFEQLDVLIGTMGLHPGSKIIITTKDASLTEKCRFFEREVPPKHTKHLLDGLNQEESLQLLSWHALKGNDPSESYGYHARKVVKYCGGHPLALKVLGSSLLKEDIVAWEDTIELLQKETNPTIQRVLQISFDSLPSKNDKELFKHIACFFIGEDRELTEATLKECGMCTTFGFSKLIDRCLLTIGPRNELTMHQLLQEMGRDLVRQESPEKPWKRSRLWNHKEAYDVLKKEKGNTRIQGLALDTKTLEIDASCGTSRHVKEKFGDDRRNKFGAFPLLHHVFYILSWIWCLFAWGLLLGSSYHNKHAIKTCAFSKMDKLQLLHLHYVKLQGSYKHFPKGLRWLSMHGFPLSYIPWDIQMENVVALDISYSNLQHLWKKPKLLKSLKFLILRCCRELVSVGHFNSSPLLERLILAGCVNLVELGESIGDCDKLFLLDLSGCTKLKKLPRSMSKLKNLKTLSIDGCSNLAGLPTEIKDMESLEVLYISKIVEVLPRSLKLSAISLPTSLVKLSLINNNLSNESFPIDFGSLSMLEELCLDENPIESLPDCVRSLSRLEFLSLNACHRLKTVLSVPRTIKRLHISGCESLEKITFHPEMLTPPDINYQDTPQLSEIAGRFKLQATTEIDEEILRSLGWVNIHHVNVEDHKFPLVNFFQRIGTKMSPIVPVQMLHESGIFSSFFQGNWLPDWITYISCSPHLHFTLRSSGKSCRIRGLNMCIAIAISRTKNVGFPIIRVRNSTKNYFREYKPQSSDIPKPNEEGMVWLSHWMLENNEFEDGDEVLVQAIDIRGRIKVCGVSVVYDDQNENVDLSAYVKSWNRILDDVKDKQCGPCDHFNLREPFNDCNNST